MYPYLVLYQFASLLRLLIPRNNRWKRVEEGKKLFMKKMLTNYCVCGISNPNRRPYSPFVGYQQLRIIGRFVKQLFPQTSIMKISSSRPNSCKNRIRFCKKMKRFVKQCNEKYCSSLASKVVPDPAHYPALSSSWKAPLLTLMMQ